MLHPLSIWLVATGEPLDTDEGSVPLHRSGRLSRFLAERGHVVTWWTSRFDHRNKRPRRTPLISTTGGVKLRLIDSPGYARNVSLQRIRDHRVFAANFLGEAAGEPRPDIIMGALPTVDVAAAAIRAGALHHCPTVVHIEDQWPDVIVDHFAAPFRPLVRIALSRMNDRARFALSHATAITGLTDAYVSWGLEKAGRAKRPLDEAFPLAREMFDLEFVDAHGDGRQELARAGVPSDPKTMIVSFTGTLGEHSDIPTVIAAARELLARKVPAHIVIAGDGEYRAAYVKAASGLDNVTFTGQLSRAGVGALLRASGAGLAPFRDIRNYRDNVPNKVVEYLCAGLPVITPLAGEMMNLVSGDRAGLRYSPGSAQELAEVVERLTRDVPFRQSLAENARAVFLNKYEATRVHGRFSAFLERIAGEYQDSGMPAT